jgi:streptomycin 6-kinase
VVAAASGLDGDRLFGWSQVIAPLLAVAYLGNRGDETVIEELLAVSS